jgi:hypothetical protein
MNKKHLNILMGALLIGFISCTSQDVAPTPPLDPDLGKTYFNLEEGFYREYDVYEIIYEAVDRSDTLTYQLREEVREAFVTENAEKAHLIYRYRRDIITEDWQLDSVWTARIENQRAIMVENNIPLVKMTFPSDTINTWDRNLFNDRDQNVIRANTFNQPFTVGFNTYLNASQIVISDIPIDSLIPFGPDERYEVYADSIGLVLKEYNTYRVCAQGEAGCDNKFGVDVIKSGRYYRETLIAFGRINEDED